VHGALVRPTNLHSTGYIVLFLMFLNLRRLYVVFFLGRSPKKTNRPAHPGVAYVGAVPEAALPIICLRRRLERARKQLYGQKQFRQKACVNAALGRRELCPPLMPINIGGQLMSATSVNRLAEVACFNLPTLR
jgi:hypothetical protein